MKSILFFLTAAIFFSKPGNAQTTEDSVKNTVNQLFTGMKNADGKLVSSVFADSAVLQTIGRDKEGKPMVRNENVKDFTDFINTVKKGAADEQIVFDAIKTDGPMALAWTPYKFYFDGNFSHCGVNCFLLVRLNGQWKIQYLIDTRRKQPCN
jgi:putative lumazine-binding protein